MEQVPESVEVPHSVQVAKEHAPQVKQLATADQTSLAWSKQKKQAVPGTGKNRGNGAHIDKGHRGAHWAHKVAYPLHAQLHSSCLIPIRRWPLIPMLRRPLAVTFSTPPSPSSSDPEAPDVIASAYWGNTGLELPRRSPLNNWVEDATQSAHTGLELPRRAPLNNWVEDATESAPKAIPRPVPQNIAAVAPLKTASASCSRVGDRRRSSLMLHRLPTSGQIKDVAVQTTAALLKGAYAHSKVSRTQTRTHATRVPYSLPHSTSKRSYSTPPPRPHPIRSTLLD